MSSTAPMPESGEDFYNSLGGRNLAPLWRMLAKLVPEHPATPAAAAIWRYEDVRPFLMESGRIISTEQAERRVLMLENPALPGEARTTGSLYGGLQLILPGETARNHRHAASALRFVIEGTGGWTSVNGEKTWMRPGDFVVTPSWAWHGHGNEGDGPVVWLDGLDIHIVNLLDTGFREDTALQPELPNRPAGATSAEFGANLLPMDAVRGGAPSPIFNYPYERTRAALDEIAGFRDPDPYDGHRLRFANPLSGDWAIPTIATWMQLLPAGFATRARRSTDGTIYVVVEGNGHSIIDGVRVEWQEKDVFIVPSWAEVTHHAAAETFLCGASDRATQEKHGLWREQKSN